MFLHQIKVQETDLDAMNHVNNVVYVRYIQEVAEAHWLSIADRELQKEVVWVVLRHEIDYKKPAFLGETLTGKTWVEPYKGPMMPRHVELFNEKEELVVKAKTNWCALDGKSFRPKRISQELYQLFI